MFTNSQLVSLSICVWCVLWCVLCAMLCDAVWCGVVWCVCEYVSTLGFTIRQLNYSYHSKYVSSWIEQPIDGYALRLRDWSSFSCAAIPSSAADWGRITEDSAGCWSVWAVWSDLSDLACWSDWIDTFLLRVFLSQNLAFLGEFFNWCFGFGFDYFVFFSCVFFCIFSDLFRLCLCFGWTQIWFLISIPTSAVTSTLNQLNLNQIIRNKYQSNERSAPNTFEKNKRNVRILFNIFTEVSRLILFIEKQLEIVRLSIQQCRNIYFSGNHWNFVTKENK